MAVCAGCGSPVEWRKNDKTQKSAPVNVEADPNGNVWLEGQEEYHVLTKAERASVVAPGFFDGEERPRYTLHFATCETPEAFRKRDQKAHRAK